MKKYLLILVIIFLTLSGCVTNSENRGSSNWGQSSGSVTTTGHMNSDYWNQRIDQDLQDAD